MYGSAIIKIVKMQEVVKKLLPLFYSWFKNNPSSVKATRVFDCKQSLAFNLIFQKEVSNT